MDMDEELERCTAWMVNWFTCEGETPMRIGSYSTKEEAEKVLARYGEDHEGHGQAFKYYTCCPGMRRGWTDGSDSARFRCTYRYRSDESGSAEGGAQSLLRLISNLIYIIISVLYP